VSHDDFADPRGFPEPLPQGERILWQGAPRWTTLAIRALHVRKFAVYFAALLALRGAFAFADGQTAAETLYTVLILVPFACIAVGFLALVAWLAARTAVYTITDRRVVMKIGIVLDITLNLPFARIESAALNLAPNGDGDIALQLAPGDQIAWANLWPHARPWQVRRTQPMLRAVPDASAVATMLASALAQATGGIATVPEPQAEAGIPDRRHEPMVTATA